MKAVVALAGAELTECRAGRRKVVGLRRRRIGRNAVVVARMGAAAYALDGSSRAHLDRLDALNATADKERLAVLKEQPCECKEVGIGAMEHGPHFANARPSVDVRDGGDGENLDRMTIPGQHPIKPWKERWKRC